MITLKVSQLFLKWSSYIIFLKNIIEYLDTDETAATSRAEIKEKNGKGELPEYHLLAWDEIEFKSRSLVI